MEIHVIDEFSIYFRGFWNDPGYGKIELCKNVDASLVYGENYCNDQSKARLLCLFEGIANHLCAKPKPPEFAINVVANLTSPIERRPSFPVRG